MASFLQLSKSYVPLLSLGTLRSRRSRQSRKNGLAEIKNPASSAGRFLPHTLSEGFARSSTVVYPVFVTNLTSVQRGDYRPVGATERPARSSDIRKVYRFSGIRQVGCQLFLQRFPPSSVNFTTLCGNSASARGFLPPLSESTLYPPFTFLIMARSSQTQTSR